MLGIVLLLRGRLGPSMNIHKGIFGAAAGGSRPGACRSVLAAAAPYSKPRVLINQPKLFLMDEPFGACGARRRRWGDEGEDPVGPDVLAPPTGNFLLLCATSHRVSLHVLRITTS
ncbi:hypothetical protein ATC00_24545 [Sinorhizobium americanum]|nr:hypothetical protein ATC00_24545 [Sinorhizobium americanum]